VTASVQCHPRFAGLRDELLTRSDGFKPWMGTVYRFQTLDFPSPTDVLSGHGARMRGGRWNPRGLPAVYGSTTDTTALQECQANDRYYGVVNRSPRILVAIEATLTRMLDLSDFTIRRALGITLQGLAREDWRRLQDAGLESLSQTIGRAVAAVGGSGILARSAACAPGINVVVFPGAHGDDRLEIVDAHRLERLTSGRLD